MHTLPPQPDIEGHSAYKLQVHTVTDTQEHPPLSLLQEQLLSQVQTVLQVQAEREEHTELQLHDALRLLQVHPSPVQA